MNFDALIFAAVFAVPMLSAVVGWTLSATLKWPGQIVVALLCGFVVPMGLAFTIYLDQRGGNGEAEAGWLLLFFGFLSALLSALAVFMLEHRASRT